MTQPFVTDDLLARREGRPVHELLLYSKKAITSFELPSGKVNARLPIEPGDLAFFFATPIGDRLALLATDDDSHTLYRTETGDPIWQISTERVPGIIDQIYEVGNGTLLLFVYDDSKTDLASIYQVQADDGTILWHRPIFKIGNYDAGNDALNRPFVHLSRAGRFGYEIDKETELVRYGAHDTLDDRMNVWRRVAGLQNELQNRGKDVSAYMDLVKIDGDAVLLAVGGRKARLLEREKGRKSAEGLYVLDLSTGTIVSSRPTEVLPETRYDDAPSLHLTVIPLDTIDEAVVISKSSVHLTNGDRFTHYDFGEGRVERIDTSGTPLPIFFGVHHDDVTEVWMIDVLADTLGAARVARSDEENVIFPFESRHIDRFIDYADGHLSSYPLSAGSMESDRLPAPTWSIDEDRIDAMDLGNITWNKNMLDPLYGIRLHDKGVLLAGEDAIAWISPDGSCTWKHEWQPNKKKIERAPMYLGDYLLYAVNGEQVIIRLDCDGTVVAEHEIDEAYDDLLATTEAAKATEHHTVILVDRDDNVIWCYHLP